MDQEEFDKIKARFGEQAALRFDRYYDEMLRVKQGKGSLTDVIGTVADGALFRVYAAGHLLKEGAEAVGHAAQRAASAIGTDIQHVLSHDKLLETPPAAPSASAKDTPARDK
jgi:hypothetical protein